MMEGMIRFLLILVAGGCLMNGRLAWADDAAPPMAKQYSADMVITAQAHPMNSKIFKDNDKIRTEMNAQGMQMVSIIRPDQLKMYNVMVAQKMVMVIPLDPERAKKIAAANGTEGKFDLIGPDTVDGVACTKYKVTSSDNKVSFMWIAAAKKVPVKMASEDGSYNIVWKNVQIGPQDAVLFEPPADYQVMQMPAAAPAAAPAPAPAQ
jgi:hypothetical protein